MITGKIELNKRLEELSKIDMSKSVGKGISFVQEAAKSLCGGFRQSSGELRESIFTEVQTQDGVTTGICYTNKEYAPYVEFGTGPRGQEQHEGISPEVAITYSQTGWIIPGGAMDREKAESYGLGVLENKGGELIGYLTNGQPAKPFMYPALKDNEKEIMKLVGREIKKQL